MPNWVENDLRITGSKKQIQRFKEFAKTGKNVLDTDKFIPYPKELKEKDDEARRYEILKEKAGKGTLTDKEKKQLTLLSLKGEGERIDGFNSGGYEWCNINWGTKWGICHAELNDEDTEELFYQFDTAWSPPLPVIIKMAKMFPKLKFDLRYFEGAMGFNGMLICENGKVEESKEGEYFGDRGG